MKKHIRNAKSICFVILLLVGFQPINIGATGLIQKPLDEIKTISNIGVEEINHAVDGLIEGNAFLTYDPFLPNGLLRHRLSFNQALIEAETPLYAAVGFHSMPATRLETIYAGKLKDENDQESLKVFIETNGPVNRYESYTSENPARIVFDIYDVRSPYSSERTVPVDTEWVRRVRYNGYPDRLRVILDTKSVYLANYTAYPIENGLIIHIGSSASAPFASGTYRPKQSVPAPPSNQSSSFIPGSSPNRFGNVYATQHEGGILISVRADQPITQFKPTVIQNPPKIVYEIYGLDMESEKGKTIDVGTPEVKRIRYVAEGNALKLEIDTNTPYLSAFSSYSDKKGMVIQVGNRGLATGKPRSGAFDYPAEMLSSDELKGQGGDAVTGGPTAWIDRIDFVDEGQGKTSLIIGTTHEVGYDLQKISDKNLLLKLYNTKIPAYRQRPLITDRFDSAVDDIRPLQQKGNASEFSIKLRETVPHFVEQSGNLIMVHFEPSAQSPKPSEIAGMPSWQSVLGQGGQRESTAKTASPQDSLPVIATPPPVIAAQSPAASKFPSILEEPRDSLDDLFSRQEPQKRYTGEKIALDFYKTDIKNVFRILREVSGLNFAVERDVQGEVTLTLDKPVPWDQVLDLVLKMNRLGKTIEGDIIRIATSATLEKEAADREKKRQEEIKAMEARKKVEPIFTEYIPVNYSSADGEIKPHIEKILTPERGSVSVDKRTNMVILTDTKEKIRQAVEIVEKLDRVTPQVVIEARVVEVNTNFAKQFGVEWGADSGIFNDDARAGIGPQRSYSVLGGTYGYGMSVNMPPTTYTGSLGFDFKRIAGTPFTLNARLRAMESRSEGKIISAPKILTLDNKAATIKQGVEIPYAVTDKDGNVTILFKEVNLLLNVTPHITPDDRISIILKITKNDIAGTEQQISTKEANTEFLINDGDTIVIGGIRKTNVLYGTTEFPGMAKIPLLGWLFKSKSDQEESQELLIFITTKIVQLEQKAIRTTS